MSTYPWKVAFKSTGRNTIVIEVYADEIDNVANKAWEYFKENCGNDYAKLYTIVSVTRLY